MVLTAALGWAVLSGHAWARWLMGILLILGSLGGAFAGFALGVTSGGAAMLALVGTLAVVHGAAGVTLLASPSISAYLRRVS